MKRVSPRSRAKRRTSSAGAAGISRRKKRAALALGLRPREVGGQLERGQAVEALPPEADQLLVALALQPFLAEGRVVGILEGERRQRIGLGRRRKAW